MIAKPSIAFNDFAGTAKDVTARNVNGRNILSVRAKQSRTVSPAQATKRNQLSKISRAYKQLTDSQMKAWGVLAEHLKGISTFGKAAEMTAHNAFVRINSNREMVGMPLLDEAPSYIQDVPEVEYEDLWISKDRIIFVNIQQPSDEHVLVFKMTAALSPGVSSGQGQTVIITPGLEPEFGDADLTELYTEVKGMTLEEGKKYFCEFYWLDKKTGFTGESTMLSAICKDSSVGYNASYVPRTIVEIKEQAIESTKNYIYDASLGFSKGSTMVSAKLRYEARNTRMNAYFKVTDAPKSVPNCSILVLGRGYRLSKNSVNLLQIDFTKKDDYEEVHVNPQIFRSERRFEVFDSTIASTKK